MPKNPKDLFLKRFEDKFSVQRIYGQSFYELNSSAILYFRYSKAHKNQFFFGVESDDLQKYTEKNLFILFICEYDDQIVSIPIEDFKEMIEGTEPISNQWKILITKEKEQNTYTLRISGKGKYDVTKNLNSFDFRPKEFRSTTLPSITRFIPLRHKRKIREYPEEIHLPIQLEDRLISACSDSKHPIIFEKTVSEVFERLGFSVKHIGGAGNTDILIETPIKGIVDCKSTSGDSLTHINVVRLKRHKKENDASFFLVVSVGFDRAVVKDAEMEACGLIPVQILKEILLLSNQYTISPFDLEPVLKKPGLIVSSDIESMRKKGKKFREMINSILRVARVLDYKPRDFKEIKGRLDYEAEQKQQKEINEKEIKDILNLFSSPILSIVEKKDEIFFSRYSQYQIIAKLKNTLMEILSPIDKG
jgi:hypothetical protein